MRNTSLAVLAAIVCLVLTALAFVVGRASAAPAQGGGYVIEHDAQVASEQPGTHGGGGSTTGYSFFAHVPGLEMVFRKRALHPGSGIGYHLQKEDEIYYVLSGTGEMRLNDSTYTVTPGTAILTRTGASHGLRQTGPEDLVILISYLQKPR
jgi:mannose-6-phosphate isomerase-like protein (cupin superfamily)